MSGVFQNIDPPSPSLPGDCVVYPPAIGAGEGTLAGWSGGGGSIIWKRPDTALYSSYVSILCAPNIKMKINMCVGRQEQPVQPGQVPSERRLRLCPQASPPEAEEPLLHPPP